MNLTRGERNRNPGNIEKKDDVFWMGQAPSSMQTDSRFVVFIPSGVFPDDAKYGLRSIAKTVLTYYRKHGITTVRGIIERWAPPKKDGVVENDTAAYIAHVCSECGADPDRILNVQNPATLASIVRAIVLHENGRNLYSDASIFESVSMAMT